MLAALLAGLCAPAMADSDVVISQVYGGGGNAGAKYKQDFIELFNRSDKPVAIGGWSVQYASAAGPASGPWALTAIPAGTVLQPGKYFLVREAPGASTTAIEVPADYAPTATIAIGATGGKVALLNTTVALSGTTPAKGAYVDMVGWVAPTGLKAPLQGRPRTPRACCARMPAGSTPTPTTTTSKCSLRCRAPTPPMCMPAACRCCPAPTK